MKLQNHIERRIKDKPDDWENQKYCLKKFKITYFKNLLLF